MPFLSRASCLSRTVVVAAAAFVAMSFHSRALQAQELPAGVQLGMSVEALQQALPGLERVTRPQRLAGGLAGWWRWPAQVAGLPGYQTFFFQAGLLRRVEFFADTRDLPDAGAAAFERIVSWGRSVYGPERAARDSGSSYATWALEDSDVYTQNVTAPQAGVRLVYKARQARDASAL